ncbi:MAG TPA: GxxExxY protein [Tepidisphaeraceae bacterium]|nr:GxxExxY protein [Tepidisphaeraceae bacterium]
MPYEDEIPPYGDLSEPPPELDALARAVIGAAIEVHRHLGPGLSEEPYQRAMGIELELRSIPFEAQKELEIIYKGVRVGKGKIDLLIAGRLVVEIKAVETLSPVHRIQTRFYMLRVGEILGLLINFNVPLLKDGIRRIIESA